MTSPRSLHLAMVSSNRGHLRLVPPLPIGTAAGAGGPQRGGPSRAPPLPPAAEDVCSSEWGLFESEIRAGAVNSNYQVL